MIDFDTIWSISGLDLMKQGVCRGGASNTISKCVPEGKVVSSDNCLFWIEAF